MSLGSPLDAKEQVRQAIDIVDLVGSYMQLRRQGRNFVGVCPWHDDRRPSFQVNPDRQSFKCWVCDIGGDVFSFIMKMENLEFREALELLAERGGVSLRPAPRGLGGQADDGPSFDKKTLLRVTAWAEDQFHRFLLEAPEAEVAREYLADRAISPESIRTFHLGFSPSRWEWLAERARGTEWTTAQLEKAGLLIRREVEGTCYDRFRGRIIFSIRDARSRPIAFGGRVLPQLADDRSAKYINSPETPLFSKSRELFGLDVAREGIGREGYVIVMEGYTDCIMAHQAGLTNVVAVLGTALGEGHLQILRRFTDSIVLVLDGDEAGRRRTNEIIDTLLALFVKNQVDLKILTLPKEVDPCDFIATHGSKAFRQLLAGAVDALEHKFNSVTNGLDTATDTHRSAQAVEQVLGTLAQIRTAGGAASAMFLREQQMLGRISRQFHLPEEHLRSRLKALRSAQKPQSATADREPEEATHEGPTSIPIWDREILELILLEPTWLARIATTVNGDSFESPIARAIYEACLRLNRTGQPIDFPRLTLEFDDIATVSALAHFDEMSQAKASADREQWLTDLLATAARRRDEHSRRETLHAAQHNRADAEALLAQHYDRSRAQQLSEYEKRKK